MNNKFEIKPTIQSKNAKAIVFAPNNEYCKYFAVALQSIIDNSTHNDYYDIVVFDSDITERNKKILYKMLPQNFNLRFFNTDEYIKEILGSDLLTSFRYWSISMYYRIFIPLLMPMYERVLYLDSDTVVNGDINDFFNINFDGKEILTIVDSACHILHLEKDRYQHMTKEMKLKNPNVYFNSGVIMFNTKEINTEGYIEKFKEILTTKNLLFPDQDILNIMFENKTKNIPTKWNYQYGINFCKNYEKHISEEHKKDLINAKNNPIIIHYTSSIKPWVRPQEELANIFWEYARKTPFYEEILFTNVQKQGINENTIKNIQNKFKIYFVYYKCKILSKFAIGARKKHYQNKQFSYKTRVKDIRRFSKI